jgi:hypothetical protein
MKNEPSVRLKVGFRDGYMYCFIVLWLLAFVHWSILRSVYNHAEMSSNQTDAIRAQLDVLMRRFEKELKYDTSPKEPSRPIPANDEYDLHYWTCNVDRCADVFRAMTGRFVIYECTHIDCKRVAGPTDCRALNKTRNDYAYWAVGRERGELVIMPIGTEKPHSLYECDRSACRWIASRLD